MADQGLLAQQRRSLILEQVRRDGAVKVAELVDQFGVSDMTVRRDLDVLARGGGVEKVHGGAIAVGASTDEPGFEAKSTRESAAKAAVASAAADLVEPGSVVAVSAGTTAFAVASRLLGIPRLTVVTNSLPVGDLLRTAARELGDAAPALLLTGGSPTRSAALVGPLADQAIRSLHVDLLILGTHGVSEQSGLTTPNMGEAETNRALVAAARRVMVVADHTKWGVTALSSFAGLAEVGTFVTDDGLPEEARSVLAESVGALVVAPLSGAGR
ncbi:DeoR family transcriptional regulator [Kitasatospora herbaricolor]|uniref:DeoR/GlpR family DNA-binding transcription regulator n=1 Tax=Kitasatospora herbaricolor TaxID=68217 RepID=UPI001988A1E8|nr:DeoR/GlpR family DNA-binding transcription regulator [Kitasatospora herbaricolor]MDQ0306391.1 DeoR/GlpR family transcriptional regulator of sugar metabolism [Kitasatospora herbaricolor]GGV44121.1 DeoR family transcriptional regulator [Kitasatospora herbaricolor]